MIWLIGAGFLYLLIIAGVCIVFARASICDSILEDRENQFLAFSGNESHSDFQEHASPQTPDIIPSLY